MTDLALAQILRAQTALNLARESVGGNDHRAQAKAFSEIAKTFAGAKDPDSAVGFLQHSRNEIVAKAAAHTTLSDLWADPAAQAMAQSYIASVGEPDLLTAIGKFARVIAQITGHVLIATGAAGDVVAEGGVKVVKQVDLNVGLHDGMHKSSAIVVVSQELLRATGEAGRKMFEDELTKAVIRAANSVLKTIIDTSTVQASAGTDPLASLRAGIRAAGASDGYVIAMPAGDVAWLATHEANKGGMSVRGGTFVSGVEVVAIDDLSAIYVIPASRFALFNGGIKLHPTSNASVNMSDSPTSPSQLVSLWQANCGGILCERYWRIDGDASGVVVVS